MLVDKATRFSRLIREKLDSLTNRSIGAEKRPRNLIVTPRLADFGSGRRVVLMSRRLEDGLMSAFGTMTAASSEGGSLCLLSLEDGQELSERVDMMAGEVGVDSVICERIREGEEDKIRSLLRRFEPEIVIMISPLEEREAFDAFCGFVSELQEADHLEAILLSELRVPLLPDLLVNITETFALKERLLGSGEALELALALNQYRSATNMKGRGFAEGFHFLSPGDAAARYKGGSFPTKSFETGAIPFYRGVEALTSGKMATWADDGAERQVLVISPHFDDESIGCGGAISRHVDSGDNVTVLFMTDGREGDPEEQNRDLVSAIRKSEAEAAADSLGVGSLAFLDEPETMLMTGPRLLKKMRQILVDTDPDIVYLPSFLDNHIDHVELNRVLYHALSGIEGNPEIRLFGLWTLIPANLVVDITDVIDRKIEAVNKYRSQIVQVDYLSVTLALNRYWSIRYGDGGGYSEAYYSAERSEYIHVMEELGIV